MSELKKITEFLYVVLDMDGTIVDSMPLYTRIFIKTTAKFGIGAKKAKEFYTRSAGTPLEEQIETILRSAGRNPGKSEIRALADQFRKDASRDKTKFFPWARKIILSLASRGITVMISSGAADQSIAERLEAGGLVSAVPFFCGSSVIPKGPAHIVELARKLNIRPEDLAQNGCFCGDGETDMRIATQTGLYPIGVAGTVKAELLYAAGAKRVVGSIGELLKDL